MPLEHTPHPTPPRPTPTPDPTPGEPEPQVPEPAQPGEPIPEHVGITDPRHLPGPDIIADVQRSNGLAGA